MKSKIVFQGEPAECGLACICMLLRMRGVDADLGALRKQYPQSVRGSTALDLRRLGNRLGLGLQAFSMEYAAIAAVGKPMILHWNFEHFVVLEKFRRDGIVILDPSEGRVFVPRENAESLFTGVALVSAHLDRSALPDQGRQLRSRVPWFLVTQSEGIKGVWILVAVSAVIQVAQMVLPVAAQLAIDSASANTSIALLVALGALVSGIAVSGAVLRYIRQHMALLLGAGVARELTIGLVSSMFRLGLEGVEKKSTGDLLSRADSSRALQHFATSGIFTGGLDGLFALVALLVLAYYSSLIALVALGFVAAFLVSTYVTAQRLNRSQQKLVVAEGREEGVLAESLSRYRTMLAISGEEWRLGLWSGWLDDAVSAQLSHGGAQARVAVERETILSLEMGVTIALLAMLVGSNEISAGAVVAVLTLRQHIFSRLAGVSHAVIALTEFGVHLSRIGELIRAQSSGEGAQMPSASIDRFLDGAWNTIELVGASYTFEGASKPIFNNLGISIRQGDKVCIQAPSGSGKTTFLEALAGLRNLSEGHISIDGMKITGPSTSFYRSGVAIVLQNDQLFTGSILENIASFSPEPDLELARECSSTAQLAAFIDTLPLQYNSKVSDLVDLLSAGQRQRLILARALYSKPSLLIMDEGTANLDLETENIVLERLSMTDLTIVYVAHRPEQIIPGSRLLQFTSNAGLLESADV